MAYKIGDKFIIEIDRIYSSKKHAESRYGVKGFANFVLDKVKLNQLLKHGCIENAEEALVEAHKKGVLDAQAGFADIAKDNYERGLMDAWEVAKKIVALDVDDAAECFGVDVNDWPMNCMSAEEAIEKIKAYEEQKAEEAEIKLGDEVESCLGKWTVFSLSSNLGERRAFGIDSTGMEHYELTKEVKKTGRHFPQVAELLKAMEESDG